VEHDDIVREGDYCGIYGDAESYTTSWDELEEDKEKTADNEKADFEEVGDDEEVGTDDLNDVYRAAELPGGIHNVRKKLGWVNQEGQNGDFEFELSS
jgi:hypothetical protein